MNIDPFPHSMNFDETYSNKQRRNRNWVIQAAFNGSLRCTVLCSTLLYFNLSSTTGVQRVPSFISVQSHKISLPNIRKASVIKSYDREYHS